MDNGFVASERAGNVFCGDEAVAAKYDRLPFSGERRYKCIFRSVVRHYTASGGQYCLRRGAVRRAAHVGILTQVVKESIDTSMFESPCGFGFVA